MVVSASAIFFSIFVVSLFITYQLIFRLFFVAVSDAVSQTSLEQVFNQHAAEAEKLKQGRIDG